MTVRRGLFVTVEGIEGVGKSTQVALARTTLEATGREVVATREPGGTPLAETLRALVLSPGPEPVASATELLIMVAARAQHTARLIRPALERGAIVLCDRYSDATYAYQGGGRGVADARIDPLIALAQDGIVPDRTILLDAPVAVALARAKGRGGGSDRIEAETAAFFERVRAKYLARAGAEPERFRVIDATRAVDEVADAVRRELLALVGSGR